MSIKRFVGAVLPIVCAGLIGLVGCTLAIALTTISPEPAGLVQEDQDEDIDVRALMRDAESMIADGEFANAAATYRKILKAEPDNGFAWQLLGYALHVDGKLDEAIEAHTKATEFDEVRATGLYNLACAWSLKNDPEKAFEFLNKALENGFDNATLMKSDSDFENIRKDARFDPLLQWCRTGKKPGPPNPLVGNWVIGSGMKAGQSVPMEDEPARFEITDSQIMIPGPEGEEGFLMNYKIDKSKSPMQIDMDIEAGPAVGSKALGIIKVDEGQMTLCYDPTGATRPETFESNEDNGFFLFKSKKAEAQPAALDISGSWTFVSGVRAGEDVTEDRLAGEVSIDGESITMPAGDDAFVMGYKIDSDKQPATIDMKVLSGPAPEGSAAVGILKRDGDTLVLCYNAMGENRPEKFESTSDNGFFLFTLKAKK